MQNNSAPFYLVGKSNELIEASYNMTFNENRIIIACLSKVNSQELLNKHETFKLTAEEASTLFYAADSDTRNAYRDLKEASERLFERKLIIRLGDGKTLLTRFVQSIKFVPKGGYIELRWADEVIPYISQLTEKFTLYRLKYILMFSSNYAIRLYELIVCWHGQNQRQKEISVNDLKHLLALENKYKLFGHFKSRIIEPAVKQINEHSDFFIDVIYKKESRAITAIQFNIVQKSQMALADFNEKKERQIQRKQKEKGKAKREKELGSSINKNDEKSLGFPAPNSIIKIDDVIAQIEGNSARILIGKDEGKFIPFPMITRAIKNGTLVLMNDNDEELIKALA